MNPSSPPRRWTSRSRLVGFVAVVAGLALAAFSAEQTASLAAGEMWINAVSPERATFFALTLSAGVILGSGTLVAAGVALVRGAPRRWPMFGTSLGVVAAGWLAIPLLFPVLRPVLQEDARDPVRFRHSLHFSGDVQGDLSNARFVQTIAGPERTCGADRGSFQLFQVRGFVGENEATITITIRPYRGPGPYRARHEYGPGVSDPGEAGMNVEFSRPAASGFPSFYQTLYAVAGTITVDPGERSGTVDVTDEPLQTQTGGPRIRTRITGMWRCLFPDER